MTLNGNLLWKNAHHLDWKYGEIQKNLSLFHGIFHLCWKKHVIIMYVDKLKHYWNEPRIFHKYKEPNVFNPMLSNIFSDFSEINQLSIQKSFELCYN